MKNIIRISLIIVGVIALVVCNILNNSKTTTIVYNNKTYMNGYYLDSSIVNKVTDPDVMIYEIADDIKTGNTDYSNYIFVAVVVGLLGFVVTRIYLKHIN